MAKYKPDDSMRYFVRVVNNPVQKRYVYRGAIFDATIARCGGYIVLFPKTQIVNSFGEVEDCYLPATHDEMANGVVIGSELYHMVEPIDKSEIVFIEDDEEERPVVT